MSKQTISWIACFIHIYVFSKYKELLTCCLRWPLGLLVFQPSFPPQFFYKSSMPNIGQYCTFLRIHQFRPIWSNIGYYLNSFYFFLKPIRSSTYKGFTHPQNFKPATARWLNRGQGGWVGAWAVFTDIVTTDEVQTSNLRAKSYSKITT